MKVASRRMNIIAILMMSLLSFSGIPHITAQTAPTLNLQAELDIGFNCPVASALSPDQAQMWILMDTCGNRNYSILVFDLTTNTFISVRDDNFMPFFESLTYEQWVSSFTSPFAYTTNDTLELIYADSAQNYDTNRIVIPASGEEAAESLTILLDLETLESLIPGYAGYPESTIYNADHTIAAVSDVASIHIFDLQTGDELFVIDTPDGSEGYFPIFAPDGQSLYVPRLLNFDDMTDNSASLSVYSLHDGAVTATYDVPTAFFWPSPDNQWIAGTIPDPSGDDSGDSLLIVVNLATGNVSQPLPTNEPARHAVACMNDGRSLADVDFTVEGDLPITSLIWLPDSSGFYTTNSYGGDAVGGGRLCFLDYSRLRLYLVQPSS
ncbi:MAG: hypothetical protein IAE89_01750 [Anaerolineae bacterium]|nr:hypothetical protein [Anaerolineae bacterium]